MTEIAINWTPNDEPAGLIFDCDGTLADTMPLHFVAWRNTLGRHGIEFPEERFYAMAGQPTEYIVEILLREQNKTGNAKAISDEKEEEFIAVLPQIQPIEPIVAVAKKFRSSKPMGVGSGSSRTVVEQVLKHIGLDDFFDAIVGAEDTENPKPAPDVFLKVAEQIGVEPSKCCVYEDADLGIEAAKSGGMTYFDIRTVHTPKRIS